MYVIEKCIRLSAYIVGDLFVVRVCMYVCMLGGNEGLRLIEVKEKTELKRKHTLRTHAHTVSLTQIDIQRPNLLNAKIDIESNTRGYWLEARTVSGRRRGRRRWYTPPPACPGCARPMSALNAFGCARVCGIVGWGWVNGGWKL